MLGERQAPLVEGADRAGLAPVRDGAQHLGAELARALGGGQRQRGRRVRAQQGERGVVPGGELSQGAREGIGLDAGDPVADPDEAGARVLLQEGADRRQVRLAPGEVRAHAEGAQALQGGGRAARLEGDGRLGEAEHGDRAAVARGTLHRVGGDAGAGTPVVCGAGAVVEEDEEGAAPAARADALRVPDRAGHGEDQGGGGGEPQDQQPERGARGGLALRQQIGHELQRREIDAARPRRRHPEQEPQGWQADQGGEGEGRCEGQSEHAGLLRQGRERRRPGS